MYLTKKSISIKQKKDLQVIRINFHKSENLLISNNNIYVKDNRKVILSKNPNQESN